jgi:hypothetical protein
VLLVFLVTLALAVVGAVVVALVTRAAMRRLGLDLRNVFLWFGLAEAPTEIVPRKHLRPVVSPLRG